jgi:uridine kinase
LNKKNTIIIGISGASASGKSLLANTIVNELGSEQVVIISEDSYYKDHSNIPFEERAAINYDHPDAFDHELLQQHLVQLQKGKSIEVPIYNHSLHIREKETRRIGQHAIIVLEGILLFVEPELRELMDIRIFMETSLDICLIRRLKRDIKERQRPSKRYADLIVPRGGGNRIAIDMIKAKMRELLGDLQQK